MCVTIYRRHIYKSVIFSHHHDWHNFQSLQFVSNVTRCGTRSASTVQTATDLWIQCWLVTVQTARCTARRAILRSLVPRALVMATLLLWCPPRDYQLFLSK
jgi:hypothetical protein